MAAITRTVERKGEMYEEIQVSSGKAPVGWAPCPIIGNLEEMQELIDDQKIFELALRQLKEDVKNKVRTRSGMPTFKDAENIVLRDKAKYAEMLRLITEEGLKPSDATVKASGLEANEDYEGFDEMRRAMQ